MIDHCETAMEGIKITGTLEALERNRFIFKGVVMSLQSLGELMKDMPEGYQFLNDSEINKIVGFRNRSAHGYHLVSPHVARDIVLDKIPNILHELRFRQHQEQTQSRQTHHPQSNKEQENRSDDEIEGDFLICGNNETPEEPTP